MTRTDRVWRRLAAAGVSALLVIAGRATTGGPMPGSTALDLHAPLFRPAHPHGARWSPDTAAVMSDRWWRPVIAA